MVAARGHWRRAHHAVGGGPGRVELRAGRAPPGLRSRRLRRCDRSRRGPAYRRAVHDVCIVAVGVCGRGTRGVGHPCAHPTHGGHPRRGGCRAGCGGHGAFGNRPRARRVRHPALGHVGFREPEARWPRVVGTVARRVADPGRRVRARGLPGLGAAPDRSERVRADRPGHAPQPAAPGRPHQFLLPVPIAGGRVLLRAPLPVGRAGVVRRRDRRTAAAAVHHPAARRSGRTEALPRCIARGAWFGSGSSRCSSAS